MPTYEYACAKCGHEFEAAPGKAAVADAKPAPTPAKPAAKPDKK